MKSKKIATYMDVIDILKRAKDDGIKVYTKDDKLYLESPKNKQIDDNLLTELKDNKSAILSFLLTNSKEKGLLNGTLIGNKSSSSSYPLSFAQERLWFLEKLQGESNYLVINKLRVTGELNHTVLENSFKQILDRHGILRTVYKEENGIPFQTILSSKDWTLELEDIQEIKLEKRIVEKVNKKFDLSEDFPLRAYLFRHSPRLSTLLLVIHHIATDAWSTPILVKELASIYSSGITGQKLQLEDLPIQYVDYAIWQKELMSSNRLQDKLDYWLGKLDGTKKLDFPTDYPKLVIDDFSGTSMKFSAPKAISDSISNFSKESGVTCSITYLAALFVLLQKYTSQYDICIGMPVANRPYTEVNSLIGFFVNMLPIRTEVNSDMSLIDLVQKLRHCIVDGIDNQEVPFEKIVESLNVHRDVNSNPLFDVVYNFEAYDHKPIESVGQLLIGIDDYERNTAKYDLTFNIRETRTSFDIVIEYRTTLFSTKTIEGLVRHYQEVLCSVLGNPYQKIRDIEIVRNEDRERLLNYNVTNNGDVFKRTFIDEFEDQVRKSPNKTAFRSSNRILTYAELNQKSNILANYLIRNYDIGSEKIVGIVASRSEWYLISILGIMKAGGAYLPIDVDLPVKRKQQIIDEVNPELLIVESKIFVDAMDLGIKYFSVDLLLSSLEANVTNPIRQDFGLNSLAYIIYTSGSTGVPKGIMIEHRGLLNLCNWHIDQYKLNSKSVGAMFSGISFDGSVWEIFPYLLSGGSLVPIIDNYMRYDVTTLCQFIIENEITHIYLPTQICLSVISSNFSLENTTILTGGELLIMPDTESNLKIVNNYGPTENSAITTCFEVKKGAVGPIPIGKPIPNVSVYVLNTEGQLVPEGVYGELCIAGESLARGYFLPEIMDTNKFVEDPFFREAKRLMYKSGDIVRWRSDGNIEFKGRSDGQVKIRGFRVELVELEAAIKRNETVKNCCAIFTEDSSANKKIIAFIVPDRNYNEKVLRQFLKVELPSYMLPSLIIELENFPLNRNGKVDHDELKIIAKKFRRKVRSSNKNEGKLTGKLIEIWRDVLEIQEINIDDNFFEIGGHSLLATRIISKVKTELGTQISVPDVFNYPTIKEMVYLIENSNEINRKLTEFIDLDAESNVNFNFSVSNDLVSYREVTKHILLTGATGFIGAYLLHQILNETSAKVYCLVRTTNIEEGLDRIIEQLRYYNIYDESQSDRIIPVLGDLSKTSLGLDDSTYADLSKCVDVIFHSATHMDHFSSFERLKRVNVDGNVEILKFSNRNRFKKIVYISTVPKVFGAEYGRWVHEDDSRDCERHKYSSGYGGSKWVGEKIMSKAQYAGFDVQIHRLGLITGDKKSGKIPKEQWFTKLLASCYELGYFTPVFAVPITPVDFVCKAVVSLGLNKSIKRGNFHIINPYRENLRHIFVSHNSTERKLKSVSIQELLLKFLEESKLNNLYLPILPFIDFEDQEFIDAMEGKYPLKKYVRNRNRYSVKKTFDLLKEVVGLEFPSLDEYYEKYLLNAIDEFKDKMTVKQ